MALNAASHNAGMSEIRSLIQLPLTRYQLAGAKTGPVTGPPPPTSSETTSEILGSAEKDPVGQHQGGKDGGDKNEQKKVKTEKERTEPEPT